MSLLRIPWPDGGSVAAGPVTLSNKSVSDSEAGAASASYTIGTDRKVTDQSGTLLQTWLASGNSPADYQVRATLISGPSPAGASVGTWLGISANRTWSLAQSVPGSKTCKLKIEIRDVGTQTVQDYAIITLIATDTASGTGGGTGGGGGGTTLTPAPGSYAASDNIAQGSADFTVSASVSGVWTWSATSTSGLTSSVASGGSASSIHFALVASGTADKDSVVTLHNGTDTWTITLHASGSG